MGASATPPAASRSRAWLAVLLAWLIPGAGHYYLDRRGRAVVFLAVVWTALLLGWGLDGNLFRPVPGEPLSRLGSLVCLGTGLPYVALRFGLDYAGQVQAPGYEYGTAFLLTAGLMNLLLVIDALDIARGRKS